MPKRLERVDSLLWRDLKIIQNSGWFCFSIDAVLLSWFVSLRPGDRVIDLGTGTGVIPLLLAARTRELSIVGLEIKPEVAEMAQRSVNLNNLSGCISIKEGDIKEASSMLGRGKYDLVTSNPPYARPCSGKTSLCSIKAAARTEILCSLEDVIREGAALLNSEGRFTLVHRPARLTDVFFLMRQFKVEPKRLQMVCPLPGKEPNLFITEGMKNGKKGMVVHSPLFIYEEPGVYSVEMKKIFSGAFLPELW